MYPGTVWYLPTAYLYGRGSTADVSTNSLFIAVTADSTTPFFHTSDISTHLIYVLF